MLSVHINNTTKNKINSGLIERSIESVLNGYGVKIAEISVVVVDGEKMRKIVDRHYAKDKEEHPVLAFPEREVETNFIQHEEKNYLGEIVLNYDYAKGSVEDELASWAAHATLHLLGIHHD